MNLKRILEITQHSLSHALMFMVALIMYLVIKAVLGYTQLKEAR